MVVHLSDVLSSLVAVGTIGLAVATFLSLRELRQQRNEMTRSAHYKRLVEESIALWDYKPQSSGVSIFPQTVAGSVIMDGGRYDLPQTQEIHFLKQAMEHLKSYPEVWQIFERGSALAKELELREQNVKTAIRSELDKSMKVQDLVFSNSNEVMANFTQVIFEMLAPEIQPNAYRYTFEAKEDDPPSRNVRVHGYWLQEATLSDAMRFAKLTTEVKNSEQVRNKFMAFVKASRDVLDNMSSFNEKLRKDVIDQVRLSNYSIMKGKCDLGY